jgi:hypothetical protein
MKRAACAVLLIVGALFLVLGPGQAEAHGWRGHRVHGYAWRGHGHHGARVYVGLAPSFWWVGPPAWVRPPVVYTYPRRVIIEEPPVYIQREPVSVPSASYWHYCESAGAYYPTVATCAEPWLRVPPRTQ